MQMIMMVFRTSMEHEILSWVEREQLPYTRLDATQAKAEPGPVPGAVTWGGANTVVLLPVPDERLNGFRDRLRAFEQELEPRKSTAGVPFHVFVLPCIQWL